MNTYIVLPAIVILTSSILLLPSAALAWNSRSSADTYCLPNQKAAIRFSFTNTEKAQSLIVQAKDSQTGLTISLGAILANQTKTGEVTTTQTSLNNGKVSFIIAKNDKKDDQQTKAVSYEGITCTAPKSGTNQPTATPTPTPTEKIIADSKTTPTPIPTKKPVLSPGIASPSTTQKLPSTGVPVELSYSLFSAVPIGLFLRKYAKSSK